MVRPLCHVGVRAWGCVSGHVWMWCVHLSARKAFPISLLVGPGDIKRQQLGLSWTVGPSIIFLPQKVRMQVRSKKPCSKDF